TDLLIVSVKAQRRPITVPHSGEVNPAFGFDAGTERPDVVVEARAGPVCGQETLIVRSIVEVDLPSPGVLVLRADDRQEIARARGEIAGRGVRPDRHRPAGRRLGEPGDGNPIPGRQPQRVPEATFVEPAAPREDPVVVVAGAVGDGGAAGLVEGPVGDEIARQTARIDRHRIEGDLSAAGEGGPGDRERSDEPQSDATMLREASTAGNPSVAASTSKN